MTNHKYETIVNAYADIDKIKTELMPFCDGWHTMSANFTFAGFNFEAAYTITVDFIKDNEIGIEADEMEQLVEDCYTEVSEAALMDALELAM